MNGAKVRCRVRARAVRISFKISRDRRERRTASRPHAMMVGKGVKMIECFEPESVFSKRLCGPTP